MFGTNETVRFLQVRSRKRKTPPRRLPKSSSASQISKSNFSLLHVEISLSP